MSIASRLNNSSRDHIEDLTLSIRDPDITQPGWGEASLRLSSLKGCAIVLFVLGIDCGTCKHVAGHLSSLNCEYAPEVSFLGVCLQTGCREKLAEFDRETRVSFPLAHCLTRELCPALGIPKATWLFFPTLIFIDQDKKLRGFFVGGDVFFDDVVANTRGVLDSLLLENPQVERRTEASA